MQQQTFGVIFFVKKYKTATNGKAPIYARITVNGKRSDVAVKRTIEEKDWNFQRGMAKGSKKEILLLNNFLEKFRSAIVETYQDFILQKKPVTAELLKNSFLGGEQHEFTINRLSEYHNTQELGNLEPGTMKNYYTTQKYIAKYLKEKHHTGDLPLSALNYKFITNFEAFLRKAKDRTGKIAMSNNGVMKHLERFCKMVNLAVKLEWLDKNPFHAYQLKFDKVDRSYLTEVELERIEQKILGIDRLEMIQDLFIFSCYTGLAYIDVYNLTPSHIVEVSPGEFWIKTQRQKTNTPVSLPLLPKALAILKKYEGHPRTEIEGKALPVISNQRLNGYLKEIAIICQIDKPLTFHVARHTFATTVTLTNGVPIESISKMLGHSKLSTTQVYARVVESKLGNDMAILKERLSAKKITYDTVG